MSLVTKRRRRENRLCDLHIRDSDSGGTRSPFCRRRRHQLKRNVSSVHPLLTFILYSLSSIER